MYDIVMKAIFNYINGSKFLRFLILPVFFFPLDLTFADQVQSAKSAKIKARKKVLHGTA